MCELQRQDTRASSSPLAFVDKKNFGKKLRSSLEVGEHFEVMPWKLYVRTLGPNSILNLFDEYLQKYTTSNLEDVTELLLTSFRAGLDYVIDSKSLESLMRIQTLANEELMDLVRKHVRDCICIETDKRAQKKLKKTLLGMLEVDAQAEGSLEVLCSLYKTQFRSDLKIANAICHASLNGSPKVKHAASLFLLGFNIKDKETDDDMPNEIELQLQASFSPIAIIKKKDFGKKLKSQLLNCNQSDVLRLCKLYVWTVGPDSILELFTRYLESLIESELAEEVIKLLLTSFRAGLDKGINSKSLQSFIEIQSLPNEDLRDLVRKHIVDCICDLEDKQAQRELKETLLRMLTVKQVDAKTEGSLAVLCSLYQSKCWCDTEMANAICSACFNGSAKIAIAASSFILEIDKADSSKILGEMPKAKLLTHLKECNQPEEKIILLKVLALMVETPVISEVAIRDLYVKLTSNQEEVAELFAAALKDYHVKKPVEAQALFKQTVVWFFERETTRKSKAAGLLFIQKVCISEQLLIYEDLKNSILTVKQYYENIKGGIKKNAGDVAKYIESAQDLIHLIEQLGSESALRQSSKRKRQSKKKPPSQKGTG